MTYLLILECTVRSRMLPQIGDIGDMASRNRGLKEENVYLTGATAPKLLEKLLGMLISFVSSKNGD